MSLRDRVRKHKVKQKSNLETVTIDRSHGKKYRYIARGPAIQ